MTGVVVSVAGRGDAVVGARFVLALNGDDGGGVPLSTLAALVPFVLLLLLFLMAAPAVLAAVLVRVLRAWAPAPAGLPPPLF